MSVIRDLFTSSVNSTMMSINEREPPKTKSKRKRNKSKKKKKPHTNFVICFTYLQKNVRPVQPTVMTIRANNSARQQASAKNRRLAMQMERRLSAMAALKIKKKSIRQRLGVPLVVVGQPNSVRDRLTLPARGRARLRNAGKNRRIRGRSLRRSQSMQSLSGGNMQRSRSMQSLNNDMAVPHRSRSRSRTRNRTPSVGPKDNMARRRRSASGVRGNLKRTNSGFFRQQPVPPQRRKRSNSVNFRNRRAKNLGNVKEQKKTIFKRGGGTAGGFQSQRGRGGTFRRRGGRGGRGRGGRGGLTRNVPGGRTKTGGMPTKEELDKELEQYMANTRSQLDKDIDSYMKESAETTEMWE